MIHFQVDFAAALVDEPGAATEEPGPAAKAHRSTGAGIGRPWAETLAGSYPDRLFLRKLKNYYAWRFFFPFHSLSKSQCF